MQADLYVSIHAPARGATCRYIPDAGDREVSIHAPARGATELKPVLVITNRVSIHAPARGATHHLSCHPRRYVGFNPRTRAGCDSGVRFPLSPQGSFNPRTRAGCDCIYANRLYINLLLFILRDLNITNKKETQKAYTFIAKTIMSKNATPLVFLRSLIVRTYQYPITTIL